MKSDSRIVGAAFGIAGIVLGATLNHFLSTERQEQSKLLELRSEAYLLFLRGQSELQDLRNLRGSPERERELERQYHSDIKEARFRMGILGSGDQIVALTDYYLLDPPPDTCNSTWSVDVEIYQAMRRDLLPTAKEAAIDSARLFYLLWNCLPPPLMNRVANAHNQFQENEPLHKP